MSETLECPECHAAVAPDDFLCENCSLLLNPQLASGEYVITEPSIVRALMSPPMRTSSREMPAAAMGSTVHDSVTVRFAIPIDDDEVPYLKAGMDVARRPLHPFEAYVASFIDGTQSVSALAEATRLPAIEIKVVLKALIERGMVELHHQPAPRPPEDALPLLEGSEFLEEEPEAEEAQSTAPPPPPPEALRSEPPPARNPFASAKARIATPRPLRAVQAPGSQPAAEHSEDLLQRVVRFEREGQVDRAIELLKRGLAQTSAPAPLYNKLALILVNQRKDFSQAAELLERAVELEPHNPVYQQNLLKVVGIAASSPGGRKEPKRGLFSRLTRRG
ncbi:MAG TPA: tetratricopeptide repeat protein [Myxococcaceae bacterium]|nr:tetratricopeptide repeat protein [Myxococcaceae bacterium]